ncbi:family 43 glycosylhydrolase [Streptomyces antimycoticus]|uniref:family 43 glycosylhydrolase n=1 Tax=Streptomyces antimycoticus TaxID=68175 RepID=UPI003427CF7F
MYAEGRYWIYPTEDGHPGWSGTRFNGFSSPDLVHWTDHGPVLDLADVSWCHENAWAPSVVRKGDTYWMYFSACQSIGVAKSANPGGRSPTRSANRSPPRGSSATSRSTRTPSSTTTAPPISTSGRAPSRRPG